MPDCDSAEDRTATPCIRSARDIKAALLRHAFDGHSKRTPAELIRLIQDAHTRSRTMPEDHQIILRHIDSTQPRAVMMLNALSGLLGLSLRYTDTAGRNFIMPENSTIQ